MTAKYETIDAMQGVPMTTVLTAAQVPVMRQFLRALVTCRRKHPEVSVNEFVKGYRVNIHGRYFKKAATGFAPRQCHCRKWFTPNSASQKSCSEACQKRAYRQYQKEYREQAKRGTSC